MERLTTIAEVNEFLAGHAETERQLTALFGKALPEKKPLFSGEEIEGLADLLTADLIVRSPGDRYEFNYNSLVTCAVLHKVAEKMMGRPVPADITAALMYADEFYLSLREPKPRTSWYFHLAMEFDRYVLVWLNQVHQLDISAFFRALTEEMKRDVVPLRSFHSDYTSAFPYLTDDIREKFELISWLHTDLHKRSDAFSALSDLTAENPVSAKQFYDYAKGHDAIQLTRVLPLLQMGLYPTDPDKYFDEAVATFKSKPSEGIIALAWFPYTKEAHISQTFRLIDEFTTGTAEFKEYYPALFCRLIENPLTPDDIREACFERIAALLEQEDTGLHFQLAHRLGLVEGFDAEKFVLLPKFLELNPRYLNDILQRLKDAEPLFNMVRDFYLNIGPAVNFALFSESFSTLQHNQPDAFELQLLKLLTDDLALARLAGLEILRSRYGGMYEVDFLKLDDLGQLRALKTLLPHPLGIEELLPLLLPLRNSPFPEVRATLLAELKQLIRAYDHHLPALVRARLDEAEPADVELQNELDDAFALFESIKKQKEAINEFNPQLNQTDFYEEYYRIEREQQAESMRRAEHTSIFSQIAKTVGVIRGSAFKTEHSEDIHAMQQVATSRLVDMRYYLNPDEYQWKYEQSLTSRDYMDKEVEE